MSNSDNLENQDAKGGFWTTLPGILAGLAGLIGAIGALIATLSSVGLLEKGRIVLNPTPNPSVAPSPMPSPSSDSNLVENNLAERVSAQNTFDAENIHDKINQGKVLFQRGNEVFIGQITSSEIRKRQTLEESGVVARIDWNDGEKSTILFMENSKVRVWSNDQEYGGSWFWDSNGLVSVNMDAGSKYQFGR